MQIQDILPIIVPAVIMQVLIQAYYIRHCWQSAQLSQRQKAAYIAAIAVFNIPAAAAYLFLTRSRPQERIDGFEGVESDARVRQGIFVLLIVAFEIFALRVIGDNIRGERYPLVIGFLAASFVTMLVNGLLVRRRHRAAYYLLPALQLLLALPVEYLDSGYSAQFVVLAATAAVINGLELKHARAYSLAAILAFVCVTISKALARYVILDDAISYVYVNGLVFFLVLASFYTLKKQLLSNERLEAALRALREQSLQLEAMSALAERNRIAGEIHDTVGHTLTSAIIAIEAGEGLLDGDVPAARERFTLAREQVRNGLNELRSSVRTIRTGSARAFAQELEHLLEDIRARTGLEIDSIVEIKSELLPIQRNVLLRAITECATNTLKHGNGARAAVLVREHRDSVHMTFSDEGEGTDSIAFGFGLSTMAERVQGIGGTLRAQSARGEGFAVSISLPTGIRTEGGQS